MHDCLRLRLHVLVYVCRAGFKKRKMIRNFCEIATQQLKVIRSFAIHFAKVIRNYPKSDSHFTMRHRLFPAMYVLM